MDNYYRSSFFFKKKDKKYLNLKVSQQDQNICLLLKKTGLKLILRQDKSIITTGSFNDKLLAKTTPMKLSFMFPLEVP